MAHASALLCVVFETKTNNNKIFLLKFFKTQIIVEALKKQTVYTTNPSQVITPTSEHKIYLSHDKSLEYLETMVLFVLKKTCHLHKRI